MKTIWYLLKESSLLSLLEDSGYRVVDINNGEYDVMICDLEHAEFALSTINPKECFSIIALHDFKNEIDLLPSGFDAWIDINSLDKLPGMLDSYAPTIEQKITIKTQRKIIERFSVDNSVHNANLEGIKLNMQESTKEIETIFEERVEEMREIHKDTKETHEKLTLLKTNTAPAAFAELEESWEKTESILERTDEVIKAMFGFIMVLQCEDRITQMIDGISNIMKNDIAFSEKNGYVVSDEIKESLKKRLVEFYTIQDQRDYAMGEEDAMKGCNIQQPNIEELLLF